MKVFSPSVTTVLSLTQVCSKTGEQWATIKTFASPWFKSWSQNLGILLTITINCFLFWCIICTSSGNYSHFHIEHLYFFKSRILLGYTKFFVHKESGYLNALKKSGWYLHWHPSKFILSPHTVCLLLPFIQPEWWAYHVHCVHVYGSFLSWGWTGTKMKHCCWLFWHLLSHHLPLRHPPHPESFQNIPYCWAAQENLVE